MPALVEKSLRRQREIDRLSEQVALIRDTPGLVARLSVARALHARGGGEAFRPPRLLERMADEERLGRKTGEGFYKWPKKA